MYGTKTRNERTCLCIECIFIYCFVFPFHCSKNEVELDAKTVSNLRNREDHKKVKTDTGHGETLSKVVVSKRKRGRPPTVNTKQQKPRREQPRLAKRPLKLSEHDSDGSSSNDGEAKQEQEREAKSEKVGEILKGKTVEEDVKNESSSNDGGSFMVASSREEGFEVKRDEVQKIENMTDPVQAMLLDMIPSLGAKQIVEANTSRASDEKGKETGGPSEEEEEPVVLKKKKKVSYRDIAGELLKDW